MFCLKKNDRADYRNSVYNQFIFIIGNTTTNESQRKTHTYKCSVNMSAKGEINQNLIIPTVNNKLTRKKQRYLAE